MTHRIYVRWPPQRATDKTTTESESVAQFAFDELQKREDLKGSGAGLVWSIEGKQHRYITL